RGGQPGPGKRNNDLGRAGGVFGIDLIEEGEHIAEEGVGGVAGEPSVKASESGILCITTAFVTMIGFDTQIMPHLAVVRFFSIFLQSSPIYEKTDVIVQMCYTAACDPFQDRCR